MHKKNKHKKTKKTFLILEYLDRAWKPTPVFFFCRIPMVRGAWWTTFHMLPKLATAEQQISTPLKVEW